MAPKLCAAPRLPPSLHSSHPDIPDANALPQCHTCTRHFFPSASLSQLLSLAPDKRLYHQPVTLLAHCTGRPAPAFVPWLCHSVGLQGVPEKMKDRCKPRLLSEGKMTYSVHRVPHSRLGVLPRAQASRSRREVLPWPPGPAAAWSALNPCQLLTLPSQPQCERPVRDHGHFAWIVGGAPAHWWNSPTHLYPPPPGSLAQILPTGLSLL